MFVFLLTRHGRKNRSTCLRSVLGTQQATAWVVFPSHTAGGDGSCQGDVPVLALTCFEGGRVQTQQVQLWLADVWRQGQVSLTALLGQRWGRFARMVSFICIATFLMHTRWPNAVLTLNHLDDMKFRWTQHVPVCCCRSPPSIFELVLPAHAICKSGTNQMVTLVCCSSQRWAGRQHLKMKQDKKEISRNVQGAPELFLKIYLTTFGIVFFYFIFF